jgi:cholest-4-en-3-one 26-monooxygenase
MMGIEKDDKDPVVELTKFVIGNDDPRYGDGDPIVWLKSCRMLRRYAIKLGRDKENNPSDDLTSMLLNKTGENNTLSIEDFAQFFMLLVIAGMETTTHTLAHGIKSLHDNKDQLEVLGNNFDKTIDTACEEILRYNPPVLYFRRTALEDTQVNGKEVKKGDRVAMWYICANNDSEKFDNPLSFDVNRKNAGLHTTFGAPGIHHCLGAQLARLEMKLFYEYMLEYMPKLDVKKYEDKILYGKSRWGNGFREFPVSW